MENPDEQKQIRRVYEKVRETHNNFYEPQLLDPYILNRTLPLFHAPTPRTCPPGP